MRKFLLFALFVVFVQPVLKAQAILVPAGTLLRCTMDDPNFSPKTAEIGDPVLCRLNGIEEFGRPVFPRGAYLSGHLDSAKEPGHFFGKGYMKIVFDRIGLPNTDEQLEAKIVAAQGQRTDRSGDIDGHGHAKRDVAEWLFPPLWPWKVITLPARGPEPKLKNEQVLTLKLMEDVEVPQVAATYSSQTSQWHYFGQPDSYSRPLPQSYSVPDRNVNVPQVQTMEHPYSTVRYASPAIPAMSVRTAEKVTPAGVMSPDQRITLVALKSETIYPATSYWVDGAILRYVLPNGAEGSAAVNDVDWQRTANLNAERGVPVTLRTHRDSF